MQLPLCVFPLIYPQLYWGCVIYLEIVENEYVIIIPRIKSVRHLRAKLPLMDIVRLELCADEFDLWIMV